MVILNNISLKPYNTFGIDVNAKHFVSISTVEELKIVLSDKTHRNYFLIGGGSNMLLTKDVEDIVIHLNLRGIKVTSDSKDGIEASVSAGENWHEFVLWALNNNYGGIENLSLIPGNVGTAPIQNIGAYGVELKDVFVKCKALHIASNTIKTFNKEDCEFDYRNSIFKQNLKGQYIILNVTFKLSKTKHDLKMSYGAIKNELDSIGIEKPTIRDVSNAVIAIRSSKLPDPKHIGNSGSFFKNPIISKSQYESLLTNFTDMPCYTVSKELVKIPAGWLIEHLGFKGKRFDNYGVHKNQALVLVNYGDADGSDIHQLALLIQNTVKRIFNINLEAEVNIF